MKYTINQGIGIFENAVSDEWCDKVIDTFETNKNFHKDRQDGEKQSYTIVADTAMALQFANEDLTREFIDHFFIMFGIMKVVH